MCHFKSFRPFFGLSRSKIKRILLDQVGAQSLDPLINVLERDASDEEIVSYALDTISNICSPDEFEEELLAAKIENGGAG